MILRSDTSGVYNTIARKVKTDRFVDNNCEQGRTYFYKIKAIDYSDNISVCSDSVVAQTTDENALIANWQFDKILTDNTANHFDVKIGGTEKYVSTPALIKSGKSCLTLDGSSFVQLPYQIANMDEMTICMWVRWTGTSVGNRQRIFDFGNSTNQYMYLTPSNGSSMRLGIKNGGTEQFLDASKLVSSIWRHVAATIGKDSVKIYVNGKLAASTADITIRPSEFKPVLNYFGRSQYNDDPIFKGYLDDVRIYNHELSAAAIANVANDLKEDVNTDGAVDTQDILKIYSFIQTTTGEEVSAPDDVNADGTVDTQDILKVYEFIQEH